MPDVFTRTKRSAVMTRIRSHGNKATELRLIAVFRAHGITGWRRGATIRGQMTETQLKGEQEQGEGSRKGHGKQELESAAGPGSFSRLRCSATSATSVLRSVPARIFAVRPDFVFPRLKLAVFVDGCFWHGCPRHATWPKHRAAWWRRKLEANRARDRLVTRTLRRLGWRVLRIWEHELQRRNEPRLVRRLSAAL
jgi:DNA mismatch endonuclease (patch repair protein)